MAASQANQLPAVTIEDLRRYHAKHFPGIPVPDVIIEGAQQTADELFIGEPVAEVAEEDEDLGHYRDGVKRTLTDDQIAMFRHSEIQALLRERRLRQEKAEDGEAEDSRRPARGVKRSGPASIGSDGRYKRKKKNRKNRKLEGQMVMGEDAREQELMAHHKTRMLQSLEQAGDEDEEDFTPRRIARELDEVKTAAVEVDYG